MDHDKYREKIDHCRKDGHDHDVHIGYFGHFRHQEAAGPHDRGHEHAADGSRRLDGTRHMRPEPGLFHHWNGKGTCGDGVGDCRTGNRTKKSRSNDRHLGRSADRASGYGQRQIHEKTARAGILQKGPKKDEQDDIGDQHGGHNAEYALLLHVDMVQCAIQFKSGVGEGF